MRKGKVNRSAVWLMLAVLTTIVLLAAGVSGENPWDADHRPGSTTSSGTGGDTTRVNSTDVIRTTAAEGGTASFVESGWTRAVHQLMLFVARHQASWLRQSTRPGSTR